MFRKLTRSKQQLSQEECLSLLKNELRGVLAVLGDGDYPYALPMNFYYDADENVLYFHSGKEGHKMDAIKRHNKASFCIYDRGYHQDGHWSLHIKSVIVFGKIRTVEHWSRDMMRAFCRKYTADDAYIENEIAQFADKTAVLALEIENMIGKLVNEA